MTDSDDLVKRAREMYDSAARAPDYDAMIKARVEMSRLVIPLLARIEALEAERDASVIARLASPLSDADRVEALEADRAILRARLAKYERVVAAAREWSVRGVWSAAQEVHDELHDALDALDPMEATDGY